MAILLKKYWQASLFVLFLLANQPVKAQVTITALPQINKEFQVVVHIIRNQARIAGVDTALLRVTMGQVSNLFSPIGASFHICEFRYIDNFQYDSAYTDNRKQLFVKYNVANRINLYMVEYMLEPNKNTRQCGIARLGGITNADVDGIYIAKNCPDVLTIGHEMGHYFGLEHTFEDSHGLELADGSNCATAGDRICDTPADPFIVGTNPKDYVSDACVFYSVLKDANGDFYNPEINNIMNYYRHCNCGVFTHDQYVKMADTYLTHPIAW